MKPIWMAMAMLAAGSASAASLVYTPVNPAFGGSPLNGSWLLNEAQAQNTYKDPSTAGAYGTSAQSSVQQFNNQLQSVLLNRLASSVASSIVDSSGNFKPGSVDTGTFSIQVVNIGNGMVQITTTDKTTGATSVFQVSSSASM
ncbi:curli assembly protein CsgF [uncultured Aquitalea sp.]|uniref:curli assembly protein CsgF n=1 Tax=uncultured Aquitalea sp. TaxID=540272 RepID=UPI0025E1D987|nr:curli assembly protein CsgF [uncultured Aquitalea sp.]